jgi:D-alanine transaminase
MHVYLDGEFIDRARASISIDDRGFLFGDAVYEALRARHGRLFEAGAHMQRLRFGMRELRIARPGVTDEILEAAAKLIEMNALADAPDVLVYAHVSRGSAPRRHAFPAAGTRPTVYVAVGTFAPKTELCAAGAAAITHPDLRWERCDLKTTNLLPNVMANQAASEAGAYEAILLRGGLVTEGTHCNVFGVVNGIVRTHPLTHRVLPGITRDVVIGLAREHGFVVREDALREDELRSADEIFLTGTTTDVMPIVRLDGVPVGDGVPGRVATTLRDALEERMGRRLGAPAERAGSR